MNIINQFGKKKIVHKIFIDNKGGSLVESALLIGLAILVLFLLIISIENIYNWVSDQFSNLIAFFNNK